mgnify:CR=1 FL=1
MLSRGAARGGQRSRQSRVALAAALSTMRARSDARDLVLALAPHESPGGRRLARCLVVMWGGVLVALLLLLEVATEPAPPLTAAPVPTVFDGQRAYRSARALAEGFPGRTTGSPVDAAAADWMAGQLAALGLHVERQPFTTWGAWSREPPARHAGLNVVAVSPGLEGAAIVIGAHRDVVPTTVEGAEDNASGSGALLELARVLHGPPHRLTYVFVSFGAEEIGLGGSRHYLTTATRPTAAMLSLDTVGRAGGERLELLDFAALPRPAAWDLAARALALGLVPEAPRRSPWALTGLPAPTLAATDSLPFAVRGRPAVGLSWATPAYPIHTPDDTAERLSPESLARVGRLAEAFVRAADADPRLLAGSESYLLYADGRYIPAGRIALAAAVLLLAAGTQLVLAVRLVSRRVPRPRLRWRPLATQSARLLPRLLPLVIAPLVAGIPVLLRPSTTGLSPLELLGWSLWFALVALAPRWWPGTRFASAGEAGPRAALLAAASVSYLGFAALHNPFFALLAAGYPLLLWGLIPLPPRWWWKRVWLLLVAPWALVAWVSALLALAGRVYLPELVPPQEAAAAVALLVLPLAALAGASR